jgi:glycosyltransferase involved in cell wall biosynthesis
VPVNDVLGLAEALIHLNQRRDLLEAMGDAALSRVAEFSWQSNVNSLRQEFERFSHC